MSFLSHISHHIFLPFYLYILIINTIIIIILIIYHQDPSEKQKLIAQTKIIVYTHG